ncbi:hypothetical protein PT974_08155 [Cladobotryum mycophilum]|uniref:N-acetyltransferase domain-containing protein n=1 Tax=Cladobotryum mycophilum TaxID=491253 RepID=A0ABR0SCJ2_9HYPO
MSLTPRTCRFERGGREDQSVIAACQAIREWLSTPNTSGRAQKKKKTASPGQASNSVLKTLQNPSSSVHNSVVEQIIEIKQETGEPVTLQMIDITSPSQLQKLKIKRSIDSWSISERSSTTDSDDGDEKRLVSELGTCPVGRWLLKTAEPPKLSFAISITESYTRDIDSCTGDLLPEIEHPETLQERLSGPCSDHKDMAWRQANMTSELQIRREIASRERLAATIRARVEAEKEVVSAATAVEEEEISWPKADCAVRPAKIEDFQRIADIMNRESSIDKCPQILESKMITASDVEKIHASCRQALQPFVVATSPEDELLDRSKWPKNADKAYKEYVQYRGSQSERQEIIFGFAFVKDARLGMLESSCPGSRYSCQIKIGVDPDHRRQSFGSALLDRILRSVAPYHKSLLDYAWRCENPGLVYEDFTGHNRRQYTRVYLEILCISKEHVDYTWRKSFLAKFEFKETAFLSNAVKTDRGYEGKWLDLSIWALDAQHPSKIVEN